MTQDKNQLKDASTPISRMTSSWFGVKFSKPPENTKIDWMEPDGHVVYSGRVKGKLWFLPDGMYIYYEPSFWRYAQNKDNENQ